MTANGSVQLVFYVVVLLPSPSRSARTWRASTRGGRLGLDRSSAGSSGSIYRLSGVRPEQEMGWKVYALAMLLFNVAGPARGLPASSASRGSCR